MTGAASGVVGPARKQGGIAIRRAILEDLPCIVSLIRESSGYDYDDAAVERAVLEGDPQLAHCWLAFDKGRPVGITRLELRALVCGVNEIRAGYWGNLFVNAAYRSSKLYPRLVLKMWEGARHDGLAFVYGAIRRRQVAAAHLAIGMQRIGELGVLAKPLRPGTLLRSKGWQLPSPLTAATDAVYGVLATEWRARALVRQQGWACPAIDSLADTLRQATAGCITRSWTAASLRQRFGVSTESANQYILLTSDGTTGRTAGVIYRMAERDGLRLAIVMQLVVPEGNSLAVVQCMNELHRRAYRDGASVVLCLDCGDRVTRRLLRRAGYFQSPERYALMWYKTGTVANDLPIADIARWSFSFADHDAF